MSPGLRETYDEMQAHIPRIEALFSELRLIQEEYAATEKPPADPAKRLRILQDMRSEIDGMMEVREDFKRFHKRDKFGQFMRMVENASEREGLAANKNWYALNRFRAIRKESKARARKFRKSLAAEDRAYKAMEWKARERRALVLYVLVGAGGALVLLTVFFYFFGRRPRQAALT